MKVYTTELVNNEVVLTIHKSIKAFELENEWCDSKFINVATTKDLEGYESAKEKSIIVFSEHEMKSQLMLRDEFLRRSK